MTLANSNVTDVDGSYGDIVTVACAPGFHLDGKTTFGIVCNSSAMWETGTCERE